MTNAQGGSDIRPNVLKMGTLYKSAPGSLFDRQGFNDKGTLEIPLSKTKKPLFIVIPASLAG